MKLKIRLFAMCSMAALRASALADGVVAYTDSGVVESDDANNGNRRG